MSPDPVLRRFISLATTVVAAMVLASCVDAPSAPEASTFESPLVFAPSLSLVGPDGAPARSEAQADALNQAFDLVDRFRMVVKHLGSGETVVDTIIAVTPGQDEYDLSVSVQLTGSESQFSVTLTALQGTRELFVSDPVTVQAITPSQSGSSNPPAATNVTLQYSGPGSTATTVQISPATLVLGPGGSGSFAAEVQDQSGNAILDVPLFWSVGTSGVVALTDGAVSASGEGVTQVVVTTPTGLEARGWAYVVEGTLAYALDGVVQVRAAAGGSAATQSTASGAGQPTWSPDGGRLYYSAGGQIYPAGGSALMAGTWPSVSPDGSKLAVDAGGTVTFANADGSNPSAGPSGSTPVWVDGSSLLVSGGSVQQVRADGTGRTTLAEGDASLPARGPTGQVAYVADGQLRVVGREGALLEGATGRPSWSGNGTWLVVRTSGGLTVVPATGNAPGAPLPGLARASDPAFRTATPLQAPAAVSVTGLDPDPPIPGAPVTVRGSGFDWIIPANNTVLWPTRDGSARTEIRGVTATTIETEMPRSVAEGQIRVETRSGIGLLAFNPELAAVEVLATTSFEDPVGGIDVVIVNGEGAEVARGSTNDAGRALLAGLQPGEYRVDIVPPEGFAVQGESSFRLTLSTESVLLEVEVLPLVRSVSTKPEVLAVPVEGRLAVTLIPMDYRGQAMTRLATAEWAGGAPHLDVSGEGLSGAIAGKAPSSGPGGAALEVRLNGKAFKIPVSVTSYVEGAVTQDPEPEGATALPDGEGATALPAGEGAPAAVEVTSEPAIGTTVKAFKDGQVVGTGETDPFGKYRIGGLFAGTYNVTINRSPELTPIPPGHTVTLDNDHPTAKADFHLSRAAVAFIVLSADPDEIDALDGTTTVEVAAYDEDENRLGRRPTTFTSLNPGIATVNANGVVTAVDNGVATVEVTVEGVTSTIDITVDQKAVSLIIVDPDEEDEPIGEQKRAFVGEGGALSWKAEDANGHPILHKNPNFASTLPAVASIDGAGTVSILSVGSTDISAEMDGATDLFTLLALGATAGDLVISDVPGPGVMTPTEVAAALIGKVNGNLVIESTGLSDLSGLEALLEVTGNVSVQYNASLANVAGLGGLRYVMGDVVIHDNDQLQTPADPMEFAQLEAVEGEIVVSDNALVTNMDVFGKLEHVGMGLVFDNNPMLADLDGLLLDHLEGTLHLINNPLLNSTNNFPNLMSINGDLIIEAGAQVFGMPSLTSLDGGMQVGGSIAYGNEILEAIYFPALFCSTYGVEIYENHDLHTASFPALDFVDYSCGPGELAPNLQNRPELPGFIFQDEFSFDLRSSRSRDGAIQDRRDAAIRRTQDSHAEVQRIRSDRRLAQEQRRQRDEAAIAAKRAASRQASVERRNSQDRDRVVATEGIPTAAPSAVHRETREVRGQRPRPQRPARIEGPQLEYPSGGGVSIWGSPALTSLDLSSLTWVMGTIDLWNVGLTSLTLPLLQNIGDSFFLGYMADLLSVSLPALVDVGYDFELYDNPVLSSVSAPMLVDIGDDLYVSDNGALGAFSLPQLQHVGYDLEFYDNVGLTSVILPLLAQVYDDVYFGYNQGLLSISIATGALLDVGYGLEIYGHDDLQTVSIPGLSYVYDDVEIYYNDALVSVVLASTAQLSTDYGIQIWENVVPHPWTVNIPGLVWSGSGVEVQNNEGLQSVTAASGDPATVDDVFFYNNTGLQTISFPNLTHVDGDFYVQEEADLQTLSAPMLETISWDLFLDNLGTPGTPLAMAFGALTSIGNYMYVQNSPGIESFTFPVLVSVRYGGEVKYNPSLMSFALPALTHVTMPPGPGLNAIEPLIPSMSSAYDFYIQGNDDLTSFDLSALTEVDQLFVDQNTSLATLGDLGPMSTGSRVEISNNPALTNVAGLAGVTDLYQLKLDTNPNLTDFSALSSLQNLVFLSVWNDGGSGSMSLPGLQRVWHSVEVINNPDLTSISAPNLTHVGDGNGPQEGAGVLTLQNNPSLTTGNFTMLETLDSQVIVASTGLASLNLAIKSPVHSVSVTGNPSLTDVSGLAGIGTTDANPAVASTFTIVGNASLSDCHVYDDVVSVIDARNEGLAFAGAVTVSNNACDQQD